MSVVHKTLPVAEAIESRRSIRKFSSDPVPPEDLDEILRLTSLAPSAWNVQPWRIHVVTSPKLKQQLQEAAYGQSQVAAAPVVIVLVSDMEDVLAHPEEINHPGLSAVQKQRTVETIKNTFGPMSVEERGYWGLAQTNIALGFLLLAAQGLGYATVPMLGFDPVKVKELLGVPEHVKIAAMVPLGDADERGHSHHRHSLERIVVRH
ncbi:MAG TPA: nitroreductase family protein [Symbiobacteriaceae bacterium]|jgi:nitroreductase|nr:nitroreductase family protein [Symbiobacteriaceae bacterium]